MPISMLMLSDGDAVLPSPNEYFTVPATLAGGFSPRTFSNLDLPDSSFIGLCLPNQFFTNIHARSNRIEEEYLNKETVKRHRLDDPFSLIQEHKSIDALLLYPLTLTCTVEQHLKNTYSLSAEDLGRLLSILDNTFPDLHERSKQYLFSNAYLEYPLCMMRKDLFDEFVTIVQQIIEQFYVQIEFSSLTAKRMESFRVFLPLLLYGYLQTLSDVQWKSTSSVHFVNYKTPLELARLNASAVPVVFAANEHFAPALGVCLASLLNHIDTSRLYDIVVLESDMSLDSKHRLSQQVAGNEHVSLRFFNPKAMLYTRTLQKNPADHISMETYYRFLIPDILPEYGRVLYLDCDTVILDDVANLYDIDLGSYVLAAARDVEMPALASGLDPTLARYLKDVLHLGSTDPYLQAGVLLLNISQMLLLHSVDEWLALAGERKYRYNDQDILNKECKGRFKILPLAYNTVISNSR